MTKKRRLAKRTGRAESSSSSSSSSSSMSISPSLSPEAPSAPVKKNRPGSRERRVAVAAALTRATDTYKSAAAAAAAPVSPPSPPPVQWSEAQRQEALRLVREVSATGMTPGDMVRLGVDRTIMLACCRELGIQFEGSGQSSTPTAATAAAAEEDAVATPAKTPKRKRRGARRPESDPASQPVTTPSSAAYSPSFSEGIAHYHEGMQDEGEERLRSKVDLETQRAALLELEAKGLGASASTSIDVASASASIDPIALRRAALASMKRKRISDVAEAEQAQHEAKPEVPSGPPLNAPRAPKVHPTARYRDIDAVDADVGSLTYEAEEDEEVDGAGNANQADDATRRSKLLAYIDDDFHYEVRAPAGQVDYSAPLPTIVAPARSTSAPRQSNGRRQPFLASPLHQIIVEFSDDDGSDGDDDAFTAARRARNANVRVVTAAYKQQNDGGHGRSRSGTPTLSPTAAKGGDGMMTRRAAMNDTQALLRSKEKEIAELKRKMEAYEQRKVAAARTAMTTTSSATTEQQRVEANDDNRNADNDDDNKGDASGSTMPAYESPLSRYPGLRKVVEEAQLKAASAAATTRAATAKVPK